MIDRKYFVSNCVICFEGINNASKCRMLSCFHIYHRECIDEWLVKMASCPICNKVFARKKDIKYNFDEEEMQQISVDNECFYSDHLANKNRHLLKPHQYRRVFQYAMPHEYNYTKEIVKIGAHSERGPSL